MNDDWKNYLLANGARLNEDNDFVFADEATDNLKALNNNIICDLSQFSQIVIAGGDAAEFMQGQFTNDVRRVDEEHSQLNALCNNKGRMIANFRLFKYQQNYFFSVKSDLVEKIINHLQNYVLRAEVAIQDVSEQLIHLGVSGDDAAGLLSPFIENIEQEIDSVSHNEDYIAIRVAGDRPRYEIFCSAEHA
ncbi:MAG: hypothetical protein RQ982_05535, partial [Gammaproteobacteria bacterium]|nr:hypothetical protein [Gammaproteobacteria bacterium]